ncbi:choline dehydrogenase [Colletotrichum kahawae]|uniref:Choline dehydrogenase n=1 Tax=Colletotrichum kahawae TaxID=34407 RepID=A0AAD9YH29_COLKA|nr:choline dehydrogenase [Colletotrichum kahawae]
MGLLRTRDSPDIDSLYDFTTSNTTDGDFYVGLDPPAGSTRLGVYYPRASTLGGCAMHNAATISLPANVEWQDIADLTGDETWSPDNMRKYLVRLERCNYLVNGSTASHGFTGYLDTSQSDYSWALNESNVSTLALHASTALGYPSNINSTELAALLGRDINSVDKERDNLLGVFTPHTHSRNGVRSSPSNYIRATLGDERRFPLTLQLNTLATKIIFDKLYSADPRHDPSQIGVSGEAFASKEVIIAGGVFSTPKLLKLSGIGPADELAKFDIPLVKDLPGVGTNMHDNLEGVIYGTFEKPVVGFWDMFMRTSVAERTRDIHFYCGSFNFIGFFPGMPGWAENEFECGFMQLQLHPRNINGTVKLRSTDPREAPDIHLGFFSQGDDADLYSMVEAINLGRSVLTSLTENIFTEHRPCRQGATSCTTEEQNAFLRAQTYSHHVTGSCAIGADDDPMAVLDSKFRVRGIQELRVVDGSVFPVQPGEVPTLATFMGSEKALDHVLADV